MKKKSEKKEAQVPFNFKEFEEQAMKGLKEGKP